MDNNLISMPKAAIKTELNNGYHTYSPYFPIHDGFQDPSQNISSLYMENLFKQHSSISQYIQYYPAINYAKPEKCIESSHSNKRKSIESDGGSRKKSISPRKKLNRFDGISEEEIARKVLPDHLDYNLNIVIIGFNPGLYAAHKGHHYAGPGNHFWKCMWMSGLITKPFNAVDDYKLLKEKIGFTNMVERTTRGSADLSKDELRQGGDILRRKLQLYKPKIAVFNGKGMYEHFSGKKKFLFGKQPAPLEGTDTLIWVMPSSSARCAQLPRAVDKVPYYLALKKLIDHINGINPNLSQEDFIFPPLTLKKGLNSKPFC